MAFLPPPIGRLAFPTTTLPGLCLELSTECLVQQRFLQCFQRGELLLVDGFEALGFGREFFNLCNVTPQFSVCERKRNSSMWSMISRRSSPLFARLWSIWPSLPLGAAHSSQR